MSSYRKLHINYLLVSISIVQNILNLVKALASGIRQQKEGEEDHQDAEEREYPEADDASDAMSDDEDVLGHKECKQPTHRRSNS